MNNKTTEAAEKYTKRIKTVGLNQLKNAWEQKILHGQYVQRIRKIDIVLTIGRKVSN